VQVDAEVGADLRVGLGDPGHGPADRLADRDPGTFGLVREAANPATQSDRTGQLGDQPSLLGAGTSG